MKTFAISLAVVIALSLSAGAFAWHTGNWPFNHAQPKSRARAPGEHFVTLDKLIVLTQTSAPDEPSHYIAMDLVFAVEDEPHAVRTKAQLPMLRSIALRTLAGYKASEIRQMTIDDIATLLKQQYLQAYGTEQEMPFTQIMIARLMLE